MKKYGHGTIKMNEGENDPTRREASSDVGGQSSDQVTIVTGRFRVNRLAGDPGVPEGGAPASGSSASLESWDTSASGPSAARHGKSHPTTSPKPNTDRTSGLQSIARRFTTSNPAPVIQVGRIRRKLTRRN